MLQINRQGKDEKEEEDDKESLEDCYGQGGAKNEEYQKMNILENSLDSGVIPIQNTKFTPSKTTVKRSTTSKSEKYLTAENTVDEIKLTSKKHSLQSLQITPTKSTEKRNRRL